MTATVLPFRGIAPRIDPAAFIAPGSNLMGDIEIGPGSSVWLGCQLRGDVNVIRIGEKVNLQDGSVVHVSSKGQGTLIGDRCTIGHMVLLHDCILEADSFVGMNACVMDGAVVESYAMVAAGALVTPGKRIPSGELWGGRPARFMRDLTEAERAEIDRIAKLYFDLSREYLAAGVGTPPNS
ncbi:MAG: gamma carbonic anhydrase family protein [Alphaproteobacteria bacterium]|nr:gamma carbonic anhydrase family protein [Alphaproteobacteria bacterium]